MQRMSIPHRLVLTAAACLLLAGLVRTAQAATGPLDGKTFDTTTTQKGSDKTEKDQLIFDAGTFESTECRPYGFQKADYTAKAAGTSAEAGVSFKVQTKSEKEGTMAWEGTVHGDLIEGKAVWTKAGQADIEYHFTGKLAPKAAAPAKPD